MRASVAVCERQHPVHGEPGGCRHFKEPDEKATSVVQTKRLTSKDKLILQCLGWSQLTVKQRSLVSDVNLFAFGLYPTSRKASASLPKRMGWKLKNFHRKVFNLHNFGDYLSYQLVSTLSSSRVRIAEATEHAKLLAIGSILWSLQDQDVIWGSGAHRHDQIPRRRNVNCIAVRGPLTLHELRRAEIVSKNCQPLFFDPAILISLIYPELMVRGAKKAKTVLIPHYSDIHRVNALLNQSGISVEVVSPLSHPLKVASKILQAERVISSSLHGLILADALGVSAVPLRLDGNREPTFKYEDYYEGSGRCTPRFSTDIGEAMDRNPPAFRYDNEALARDLASFPYPIKTAFTLI